MNETREVEDRRPDWTKLPAEFAYLTGAAERYGHLMALGRPLHRRLKASEREKLREVALQIGWHNHDLPIQSWLIQHSIAGDMQEVELIEGLLVLLEHLGLDVSDYGPKQEPQWTLHLWETLDPSVLGLHVEELREVLPDEQAFEVAVRAVDRIPPENLHLLGYNPYWILRQFRSSRTLDWIESHASAIEEDEHEAFSPMWYWGALAAISEFSWPRAKSWLDRGRPLSLVALAALLNMSGESGSPFVQEANPKLLDPQPFDSAIRILNDYAIKDNSPLIKRVVDSILDKWSNATN